MKKILGRCAILAIVWLWLARHIGPAAATIVVVANVLAIGQVFGLIANVISGGKDSAAWEVTTDAVGRHLVQWSRLVGGTIVVAYSFGRNCARQASQAARHLNRLGVGPEDVDPVVNIPGWTDK